MRSFAETGNTGGRVGIKWRWNTDEGESQKAFGKVGVEWWRDNRINLWEHSKSQATVGEKVRVYREKEKSEKEAEKEGPIKKEGNLGESGDLEVKKVL